MNYNLVGNVFQAVQMTLEPGESIFAKRGALICMDAGIRQSIIKNGTGFWQILSAKLSGESIFLIKYTNTAEIRQTVAFSGKYGSIRPYSLTDGHTLILRRGDYVASENQVCIDLHFSCNKMLKGTEPAFQKVQGNSIVYFSYMDNLIEKKLQAGEELIVDEGCIKALYDINDSQIRLQRQTNVFRNILSGEGLLLTRIVGPGIVYLNSVSVSGKHL